MKNIITILTAFLFATTTFAQVKVQKPHHVKTKLKTFTVVYKGGYYDAQHCGYKYPTIREGFECCGFFGTLQDLEDFYQELVNISEMENGEYRFSKNMANCHKIVKMGTKLKLSYSYNDFYYFENINTKWLKADLELIKSKNL